MSFVKVDGCPMCGLLRSQVAELQRRELEFEEAEAACCPEDVGFDEYISILKSKLAAKDAEIERLKCRLENAMSNLRSIKYCSTEFDDSDVGNTKCRDMQTFIANKALAELEAGDGD